MWSFVTKAAFRHISFLLACTKKSGCTSHRFDDSSRSSIYFFIYRSYGNYRNYRCNRYYRSYRYYRYCRDGSIVFFFFSIYPFMLSKNSSLVLVRSICLDTKSMASTAVISARWLRNTHMRLSVVWS